MLVSARKQKTFVTTVNHHFSESEERRGNETIIQIEPNLYRNPKMLIGVLVRRQLFSGSKRYLSSLSRPPLVPQLVKQETTSVANRKPVMTVDESEEIHASPVYLDVPATKELDRLHWIPSPALERKQLEELERSTKSYKQPFSDSYLPKECTIPDNLPSSVYIAPKEVNPYYPLPLPPPEYTLDTPEDKQRMREFQDACAAILPPYDPIQIPLELSKPWFGFALKVYCTLLAGAVIIFGNWDKLTNGYPNCFTGLQTGFWSWYYGLWAIDAEEEQGMIKAKLEKATLTSESIS